MYDWPMLPTHFPTPLTEYRIECLVETKTDAADKLFMSGAVSQADYDKRMRQISNWSDDLYKTIWK